MIEEPQMALTVLRWVILALACAPFAYYLLAIYSTRHFFQSQRKQEERERKQGPAADDFTPPVSILKPVRGLDRDAYENFASFCRQDYPDYEILFAVNDADDPAIPVIQKLIADFPERSISLRIGAESLGSNRKVNKLCRLAREAQHDLLVISDSDIRVGRGYLRAIVQPFGDPLVGAVTCMYIGLAEPQLGAELEAVGASSDFFAGVLIARELEGIRFAMGSTMATTRRRLAEIGGFEALVDQHSDDFELGRRIAERGWRVELSPYTVWTIYPAQTARSYFAHQLRWARTTRSCRPLGYLGLLLTYGLPWSLVAGAVAHSWSVTAGYWAAYSVLRFWMAWTVGVWGLNDPVLKRRLWLVPLRDALQFVVWVVSFASNRITWRGAVFQVHKDRMFPVGSSHPDASGLRARG